MSFSRELFGFMREPVRHDIGKNHHAAGVCLKVACWVNFVIACLVAGIGILVFVLVLLSAAVWDAVQENLEGPQWFMDLGPVAAFLGAGFILIATVLIVVLLALFLWWKNHTYLLWNQVAPNAQVWANVLAAVMLALAVGGSGSFFNYSSSQTGPMAGSESFSIGAGGDLVSLVLAILILVFVNVAASRGELDIGTQAKDTAPGAPGERRP